MKFFIYKCSCAIFIISSLNSHVVCTNRQHLRISISIMKKFWFDSRIKIRIDFCTILRPWRRHSLPYPCYATPSRARFRREQGRPACFCYKRDVNEMLFSSFVVALDCWKNKNILYNLEKTAFTQNNNNRTKIPIASLYRNYWPDLIFVENFFPVLRFTQVVAKASAS
jgi:hypothetical protein